MKTTRQNVMLEERQVEAIKRIDPNLSAFIRSAIDEKLAKDLRFVAVDFRCKCGKTLFVKWEASLGFGFGDFAPCPKCRAKHLIPGKLISVEIKTGKSSFRFHLNNQINARAIASDDGRYLATVSEPAGKDLIPKDILCDNRDEAERRADAMVQAAYPHRCSQSQCGQWEEFAN